MQEYKRPYPSFSLCGLNCGLCPRHHTDGKSKCPGCGGPGFHLLHPACAVISCSKKHGNVEFCFQCQDFPCERYRKASPVDSFISYRNVIPDLSRAKGDLPSYKKELDQKIVILDFLLGDFDDGRRKNYYCVAVNLLPLGFLSEAVARLRETTFPEGSSPKDKAERAVAIIEAFAKDNGIELKLRK